MSDLWNSIDLSRHGVIEAHAGTGKTYTIVKLVLRMLESFIDDGKEKKRRIHIREILLVTYTEKAAGELKKRIREELEERIAALRPEEDEIRSHLESCLNNLHEALIGTIHAVCLRLLQTWPFESNVHFDTEIVDDAEGLETVLRESMRTDWQDASTGIPRALEHMAKNGDPIEDKHLTVIYRTAKELLDTKYSQLDRSIAETFTLTDFSDEFRNVDNLKSGNRENFCRLMGDFINALDEAEESGLMESDRIELLHQRLPELQQMQMGDNVSLSILSNPFQVGRLKIFTKDHFKLIPAAAAAEKYRLEIQRHSFIAAQELEQKLEKQLLFTFICATSDLLARRWRQTKMSRGLVSYQDMLQLMDRAVGNGAVFSASLRDRLRYAIIDEFQDTSRIQWEIFRRLFLENDTGKSTRLFIVGDPKQSIYAFLGADVQSYLDARTAICGSHGPVQKLKSNFRSLDATIKGYNAIFTADSGTADWFMFDNDKNGITYRTDEAVAPPSRPKVPLHPVQITPVQIMPLAGSSPKRMEQMARDTCKAIVKLVGTKLSLPDGLVWDDITLNYGDFAVIVEKNDFAPPFIDAFRKENIPAVKYKMGGVFQSPMARALHALLQALLSPSGEPAPRLAALLTHFFNRRPETIDPEHDLEPCGNAQCGGDTLCIAHALREWTGLADRGYWAQLFESIRRRTGIAKRLISLSDGERHLADLRQIIDYSIEKLYCDHYSLARLTEHLGDLLEEEESGNQDRNLHMLETQKSSVKILTMHAAKGLEFPVVFVVTGGSVTQARTPLRWVDTSGKKHLVPILSNSKDDRTIFPALADANDIAIRQMRRERRRLLYVALTRAQAILFVPMHLKEIPEAISGCVKWTECKPGTGADNDLTPKLQELLDAGSDNPPVALFDADKLPAAPGDGVAAAPDSFHPPSADEYPDIGSLELLSRVCRQTSYSQLSRETPSAREIDRSEEVDDDDDGATIRIPSPLPGGKQTGDALHCAIENILGNGDVRKLIDNEHDITEIIQKYLNRNGIITRIERVTGEAGNAAEEAIAAARNCVVGALTTAITLPDGSLLSGVASLDSADRLAEMEFLLQIDRHWAHGYMDLVFRMSNPAGGDHPWRYFVLDWKSDTLAAFDKTTVERCIHERHYDLQAKLYSHALDVYLRGVLQNTYDPAQHLGGAVYLFLREHEKMSLERASVWAYAASPENDKNYVNDKILGRSV